MSRALRGIPATGQLNATGTLAVGLGAAAVLGAAVVRYPAPTLVAVMCMGAAILSVRFPDAVLGIGVFSCLAAGEFGALNSAGQAVLLTGGLVSLLRLVSHRTGFAVTILLVPLALVGWLGLRLGMGSGLAATRPLLACIGALLLAYACVIQARPWMRVLSWAALGFVVVSWRYGSLDATGLRFAGVSSNPNRMVMGVLVAIPLMLQSAFSRSSVLLTRIAMAVGCVLAVNLVLASGSDQGGAGLLVIVLLLGVLLTRRFSPTVVVAVAGLGFAAVVILWLGSGITQSLSPDVTTLSGRTGLYRAGWHEFLQHPLVGSGLTHVSEGLTVNRSTHNSIIGIAAATGIFGAIAWIAILLMALRGGVLKIRAGLFAGAAAVGVIVSQLVQSVELVPLTWALLLLAASRIPKDVLDDDD